MDENYKLRFPIGEFEKPNAISNNQINDWIDSIRIFPIILLNEIKDLTDDQLAWKYRPDGWNIKQLVHHCADSHMNSFIRFKLTLTEERPTIRPYFEDRWAELADTTKTPLEFSMKILEGLHARWIVLLESLDEEELKRTFIHPENSKHISLAENIGIYAWHCKHHLAHIRLAKHSKEK